MSPSGHMKENPPATAVTRQGWVEARPILLAGLVLSNLDAPENKAGRLSSPKYNDWPAAMKGTENRKIQIHLSRPEGHGARAYP